MLEIQLQHQVVLLQNVELDLDLSQEVAGTQIVWIQLLGEKSKVQELGLAELKIQGRLFGWECLVLGCSELLCQCPSEIDMVHVQQIQVAVA